MRVTCNQCLDLFKAGFAELRLHDRRLRTHGWVSNRCPHRFVSEGKTVLLPERQARHRGMYDLRIEQTSSVNLPEYDILCSENRYNISNHVPAAHVIQRLQMGEAGGPHLHAIRLV